MILITLLVFASVISFLSFYNTFPLLKLAAGAAWIALFVYCKDNLSPTITEGSGTHIAILLVIIVMAVAIPLAGLGRDMQRQKQIRSSNGSSNNFAFSEFKWRFGKDRNEYEGTVMPHRETAEEYREKVHRALRLK